jgi:hypothetical protein
MKKRKTNLSEVEQRRLLRCNHCLSLTSDEKVDDGMYCDEYDKRCIKIAFCGEYSNELEAQGIFEHKKLTAKEWAWEFLDTFYDMYEGEGTGNKIRKMSEEQALQFIKEHIEFIIGTNGASYLWEIEKQACKDLGITI